MELIEHELTDGILNAAVAVHRELGPGFLESFYEAALCHELIKRGHSVERQKTISVTYDGVFIGDHRLDLLVDDKVIIELKACKGIEDILWRPPVLISKRPAATSRLSSISQKPA